MSLRENRNILVELFLGVWRRVLTRVHALSTFLFGISCFVRHKTSVAVQLALTWSHQPQRKLNYK